MSTKILILIVAMVTIIVSIVGVMSYISTNGNVVVSESMEPALHRGDVIIVDKNPTNIQVGDIVVYKAAWFPQPVVHRVISIKNDSKGNTLYEMKGDNLPVPDPVLVSKNQIISKVVNTIPKVGYISLWIRGL